MTMEFFPRPPIGIGQVDDNEVIKFTGGDVALTTNHAVNQLPSDRVHWSGKRVTLLCMGANCHYAFTRFATAEIDRAVAATNAGVTTKVGGVLIQNLPVTIRIPFWNLSNLLYFARESDAASSVVYMWLADEPGLKKAP